MPVIGILSTSEVFLSDDPFDDKYIISNNFIKSIIDNGGIVLPIIFYDNKVVFDLLDKCDGLLIPGGTRIIPAYFEVVDYFYKKKKPILGVCMGMQVLAMYSVNNKRIIKDVDNHFYELLNRRDRFNTVHKNAFMRGSLLHRVFGDECEVNSYHKRTITEVGNDFEITSYSSDGLIEGIESKKQFAVGVQFHIEHMKNGEILFKEFINACEK